jgi:hypothetical protein
MNLSSAPPYPIPAPPKSFDIVFSLLSHLSFPPVSFHFVYLHAHFAAVFPITSAPKQGVRVGPGVSRTPTKVGRGPSHPRIRCPAGQESLRAFTHFSVINRTHFRIPLLPLLSPHNQLIYGTSKVIQRCLPLLSEARAQKGRGLSIDAFELCQPRLPVPFLPSRASGSASRGSSHSPLSFAFSQPTAPFSLRHLHSPSPRRS